MAATLLPELRAAIQNQANTVRIHLASEANKNSNIITAFLTEDAAYSISSEYNMPLSGEGSFTHTSTDAKGNATSRTFTQGGLQSLISAVTIGANVLGGTQIPVIAAKSIIQSVSVWTGTGPIPFELSLTFLTLDDNDEILDDVKRLNATVLPNPVAGGSVTSFLGMRAPNDYTLGVNDSASNVAALGSLAISIGRWFQTPPVFIVKSMTPTFSRVLTKAGKPLYANVRISMETYRTMFLEEVNDWFNVGKQKTSGFSDTQSRVTALQNLKGSLDDYLTGQDNTPPAPTPAPGGDDGGLPPSS